MLIKGEGRQHGQLTVQAEGWIENHKIEGQGDVRLGELGKNRDGRVGALKIEVRRAWGKGGAGVRGQKKER